MDRAIALAAKAGLGERSGGCFGAVVVKNGEIVGEGYNQVISTHDPTAHAEMQAIRSASRYLQTHSLDGCVLYSSGEPCPMCLCAAAWARISKVVVGSTVEDAKTYGNFDDCKFYELLKTGSLIEKEYDLGARLKLLPIWKEYAASAPCNY